MSRVSCLLLLSLWAVPAWAKVEIRHIQPAHGLVGPARTTDDVYPLDEYFVRYQVAGLKKDKDSKCDLEVAVRLTTPDGKAVVDTKGPVQRVMSLGGDTLSTFGVVTFPEKAPPGEYKLTITVRDRISSESASFERKLTCKPITFQLLMPRLFHDAEGKVPASTTGFVGENLTFKCRIVGFDRSQNKIALVMKATLRDAEGKELDMKPIVVSGDITDPDKVSKTSQANFNTTLFLHREGTYKLNVTVEDTVAKKSVTFETTLKILAP